MSSIMDFTGLSLTREEISSIDEYRKKKNTAVLTIMFTDIEGFTAITEEKGETYAHKLHEHHDRILVKTIEEDNSGVVIKYIGDAIMAVFSEPTAAVEKSLKIQVRLKQFNKEHPNLEDIKVRIGLHMGQIVIENKIQTDLFGRHVNRASRIESLALGEHVYISYSVFDSAKSWLLDSENAEFKFHGHYYLKGIKRPEEIYEVYNKGDQPRAPQKGKRKRNIPVVIQAAAAVVIVGVIGTILLTQLILPVLNNNSGQTSNEIIREHTKISEETKESGAQPDKLQEQQAPSIQSEIKPDPQNQSVVQPEQATEVIFKGLYFENIYIDMNTPLILTNVEGSEDLKMSQREIKPGKHIIHYEAARPSYYYAEINVHEGRNVIQAVFTESHLPGIQINYTLGNKGSDVSEKTRESEYFVYDPETKNRMDIKAELGVSVTVTREMNGTIEYMVTYSLKLNSEEKANGEFIFNSPADASDWTYVEPENIYEDQYHYYYISYHFKKDSIQFNLDAGFNTY